MVFVIDHIRISEGHEKFTCAVSGPMRFTKARAGAGVCLYVSAGLTRFSVATFLSHHALLVCKALKRNHL